MISLTDSTRRAAGSLENTASEVRRAARCWTGERSNGMGSVPEPARLITGPVRAQRLVENADVREEDREGRA
jgi:hypothetical protein